MYIIPAFSRFYGRPATATFTIMMFNVLEHQPQGGIQIIEQSVFRFSNYIQALRQQEFKSFNNLLLESARTFKHYANIECLTGSYLKQIQQIRSRLYIWYDRLGMSCELAADTSNSRRKIIWPSSSKYALCRDITSRARYLRNPWIYICGNHLDLSRHSVVNCWMTRDMASKN